MILGTNVKEVIIAGDSKNTLWYNHSLFIKKITDLGLEMIGQGLSHNIDCTKRVPEYIPSRCTQNKSIKNNEHIKDRLFIFQLFMMDLYGTPCCLCA